MRLVVLISVCFTASTVGNSTHRNNSVTNEYKVEKAIPSQMVGLSDESPSDNNFSRRLRQQNQWCDASEDELAQEYWCKSLTNESTDRVMAKCKSLNSGSGYVLRVGSDVDKKAWKKFTENVIYLEVDVEIIGSPLTEINFQSLCEIRKGLTISNNPSLKTINISPKNGRKTDVISDLKIKGNQKLTSIRLNAEWFFINLTLSNNQKLETFELVSGSLKVKELIIEKNSRLTALKIKPTDPGSRVMGPIQIIGNKVLSQLDFSAFSSRFTPGDVKIENNDNLESIKLPVGKNSQFAVDKLEIRQNPSLTSIELGEKTKWNKTDVTVHDNPLLSSAVLKSLREIGKTRNIQEVGGPTTITATEVTNDPNGAASTPTTRGEEAIPTVLLVSLLIVGCFCSMLLIISL